MLGLPAGFEETLGLLCGFAPPAFARSRPGARLLLRGVVDPAIVKTSRKARKSKKNWVSFAGTTKANGLEPLIDAWKTIKLPDWELHLAGHGGERPRWKKRRKAAVTLSFTEC